VALLVGAAGAQAKPSDSTDFLFAADARSAMFTPIEGKPGFYELVLRGVPNQVGVFELNKSDTTATLSTKHLMNYWTEYGDETGQFETNAPRAVLRDATSADEVIVRLRDGSLKGSTLRFEAELISAPRVQNVLDGKVGEVVETDIPGEIEHELQPTTMTQLSVYIDIPARIAQPETPIPAAADATTKSTLRTATPATRAMSCSGVYSSRLRTCWNDIGTYDAYPRGFTINPPAPFIAFNNVGLVDLGGYWFSPMVYAAIYTQWVIAGGHYDWIIGRDTTRNFVYWRQGDYYGVSPDGVTLFASDNCTWFMEKWVRNGRCW
jgi:hypothetical protein